MPFTTTPDGIVKWGAGDPASLITESQAQGDSVQAAFNKRQRYDYVWPTSSERTAQLGMVQGSRGYQVDTKSEYNYDNSVWRLATSYAEFTSSVSAANATVQHLGNLAYDSSASTDTTFITAPGAGGILVVVYPGIYSISLYVADGNVATTGRSFTQVTDLSSGQLLNRTGISVGEDQGGLSGVYFLQSPNNQIRFDVYQTTAGTRTITSRVRIGRIA